MQCVATDKHTGDFLGYVEASPWSVAATVNSSSTLFQDSVSQLATHVQTTVIKTNSATLLFPALTTGNSSASKTDAFDLASTLIDISAKAYVVGIPITHHVLDGGGPNMVRKCTAVACVLLPA